MAGLPGSRTLGLMRDPLGRSGYGIAYTSENSLPQGMQGQLPRGMQGQSVLIVDPSSGKLLATEAIVTTPGTGIVRYNPCRGGNPTAPGCIQPFSYGTRHQGQVWSYTVIEVAAWTNTLPPS
jgi:hypothetical protein